MTSEPCPEWILQWLDLRSKREWSESFELIASKFHEDTGYLAPGKDAPAANPGEPYEDRVRIYGEWFQQEVAPWTKIGK